MSHEIDEHMKALELRANVVRARLLRTVDALDARRHQVTEVGVRAKEAVSRIGVSVLGFATLSVGVALGIRRWVRTRREGVLAYRVRRVFAQFFVEKRLSFATQVAQRLTLTILTIVATEGSRLVMKNLIDGRMPDGRLAVGKAQGVQHEAMKG